MAWEVKKLKEVCKKGSSNLSFKIVQEDSGDYPVYGAKGFINNISTYHQEKEYISIIKDGAGIGRIELREPKSSVIGTLQYLLPTEDIDIHYLYYFLLGIDFLKYSQGAAIPHIYFKDYGEEEILVPPLPIQKKIVEVLDSSFEKIAKAKENSEQNLKNAKEVFESYLQKIFENKGEDWEEKEIQEIAKVINGFAFSSKDFLPKNPIKSIKITNVGVKEFVKDDSNNLPQEYKIKYKDVLMNSGDIVIALTRTIINSGLKVAIVSQDYDESLLNQRVAGLKSKKEILNTDFLYHYLCTKEVEQYVLKNVNTLMQPNLSINDLKRMTVPLPKLEIQKITIKSIQNISEQTKQLENIYSQKLSCLEELKQSILQKAFKAELTEALS